MKPAGSCSIWEWFFWSARAAEGGGQSLRNCLDHQTRANGEAFYVRLNKGCEGKMVAAAKADTSTLLRHIMLSSKGSAEHLRRRKKSEAVLTTILNTNSDL